MRPVKSQKISHFERNEKSVLWYPTHIKKIIAYSRNELTNAIA